MEDSNIELLDGGAKRAGCTTQTTHTAMGMTVATEAMMTEVTAAATETEAAVMLTAVMAAATETEAAVMMTVVMAAVTKGSAGGATDQQR